MPETQSQEKKDLLRICGADLRLVPAVPYRDPNNYVRYSERLANELSQSIPEGDFGQINSTMWRTATVIIQRQALNFGNKQMVTLTALSGSWLWWNVSWNGYVSEIHE